MAVRKDGKTVVAWSASKDTSVIDVYDISEGKQVGASYSVIEKKEAPVTALCFSADGMFAAVGDKTGKVRIIDINGRKVDGVPINASTKFIADMCFTPDRKKLLTADESGEVKVWDLARRAKEDKSFKAADKQVVAFAMMPDGKRVAAAGLDNVVKVWDLDGAKEVRKWDYKVPYQVNRPYIRGLAFVNGGKMLAAANGDSTIWLLDLPGGENKEKKD
jgi:WD40 repeat protein